MAEEGYYLSENDLDDFNEIRDDFKKGQNDSKIEEDVALPADDEVYVAIAPCGTDIPGMSNEQPGVRKCCLYRLRYTGKLTSPNQTLERMDNPDGSQVRVYVHNIYQEAMPGNQYFAVNKTKSGKWICERPFGEGTSNDTTTTTADPNETTTTAPPGSPIIPSKCQGECKWTWSASTRKWTKEIDGCGTTSTTTTTAAPTSSTSFNPGTTTTPIASTTTTACPCSRLDSDYGTTTTQGPTESSYVCPCDGCFSFISPYTDTFITCDFYTVDEKSCVYRGYDSDGALFNFRLSDGIKGVLSRIVGECEWIWSVVSGVDCSFGAETVLPMTYATGACDRDWDTKIAILSGSCGGGFPTTTTSEEPTTTTTSTTTTTTTTAECKCQSPQFCGTTDGDCTYTFCVTPSGVGTTPGCPTTTTAGPTTTTTAGPTTTTTCNCNTTTSPNSPPDPNGPGGTCGGGFKATCTRNCPGQYNWVIHSNFCIGYSPNFCGSSTPTDDCGPANCGETRWYQCIPTTPPSAPPVPLPICGGSCKWNWTGTDWALVFMDCRQDVPCCDCQPPSYTPDDPAACLCPEWTGCIGCNDPTGGPSTPTTQPNGYNPPYPCCLPTTPAPSTTTAGPTTTTTATCEFCMKKWTGASWTTTKDQCGPKCQCLEPARDGHEPCEVIKVGCGTTSTTTSTTTTTPELGLCCYWNQAQTHDIASPNGGAWSGTGDYICASLTKAQCNAKTNSTWTKAYTSCTDPDYSAVLGANCKRGTCCIRYCNGFPTELYEYCVSDVTKETCERLWTPYQYNAGCADNIGWCWLWNNSGDLTCANAGYYGCSKCGTTTTEAPATTTSTTTTTAAPTTTGAPTTTTTAAPTCTCPTSRVYTVQDPIEHHGFSLIYQGSCTWHDYWGGGNIDMTLTDTGSGGLILSINYENEGCIANYQKDGQTSPCTGTIVLSFISASGTCGSLGTFPSTITMSGA